MELSFYPLTLEALDQAAAESLCLFVAADERPLTGLAGLADWRLSGRLSRLLRGGLLTGEAGEAVLTPPGARMSSFRKLFLFGVGKMGQSEEQLARRVAEALHKLEQAGVHEAALQLPARLPVETGIRTLIDSLQGPGRAMVFAPEPQRLVTALSQAASRGQAQLERRVVKVPPPPPPPPVKSVSPSVKAQPRPQPAPPPQPPTPIPVAQPIPVAPAVPRASPLPFAPQGDRPEPQFTPAPAVPKATPLPTAPEPPLAAQPLPAAPAAQPLPGAPAPETTTPGAPPAPQPRPAAPAPPPQPPLAKPAPPAPKGEPPPPEERRPAPPPPQRYVPPPPKPSVFDKNRKK